MLVVLEFSVFIFLGFGLAGLAGSDEVAVFLSVLRVGTCGVYAAGLKLFRQYYSGKVWGFNGSFIVVKAP